MKSSTINALLLSATAACLALLLTWIYKGWQEENVWHHGHGGGHGPVIANMTVNLGGRAIQEHCQTCHPDGRRIGSPKGAPSSLDHPDITPHSIYDLGCTACHLGEGMAADLKISHGRIGNEVNRVLSGKAVQATCYRCHELHPLTGAEDSYAGSRLFFDNACGLCHGTGVTGSPSYGPDLSDAGSFLSLKQIQTAIENPKEALENSIMPKFSLSPEETIAISYFLKSRIKDPYYETPMTRLARQRKREAGQEPTAREKPLRGAELLKEKKCLACHKFSEPDGQIGPDLTYTAYMRKSEYVRNFLTAPGREIPGAVMPLAPMTEGERAEILRVLLEKTPVHLHGNNTDKNIYMMLCQRCHAAQGDGFGTIQPNLANFPRAFRNSREFFRTIPDERIVQSIEKGVPGTSMPPYGEMFDRGTINSLINLLFRGFIRADRADKKIPSSPPKPAALPMAEAMMSTFEKKCARCHGLHGTGKGPDYLKYLPRPRDLTNKPYFEALTDEQIAAIIASGVPGTGMPAISGAIPPESIWGLVGTVRAFSLGGWGLTTMDTSRREFLLKGLVVAGIGAVGATLTWIFGSVWTAAGRFSSAGWVQVSPTDRFSPGTVTPFPEYRVAIIRTTDKIGAISMECTHLGCLVNVIDRGFFCPCHGSEFGPLGQAYSGPATSPLPWYVVVEREDRLWVNMGEKLIGPKWLEVKGQTGGRGGTA